MGRSKVGAGKEIPRDTFVRLYWSIRENPQLARAIIQDPKIAKRTGEGTGRVSIAHLSAATQAGEEEIRLKFPWMLDLKTESGVTVRDVMDRKAKVKDLVRA